MRLRNPGGLAQAIATVNQVKDELMSIGPGDSARRKDAFLTWCDNWGTPQLGNHFAPTEDLFAELAESYYRVVNTPQLSERPLNGLISRECKAWDARLERLVGELEGRRAFLGRPRSPRRPRHLGARGRRVLRRLRLARS